MHETDGNQRQPCAQYHFALHGEIFEMHVFDLRRRLDLDQAPATGLPLRGQDTLQNIGANQHPAVQKRGFEDGRYGEVLDQCVRLHKSGFCLAMPSCYQYPAGKATPGQLPDFCSHIEHRLCRRIRLGRERGMMDFEVQALVTLQTGQEFRL